MTFRLIYYTWNFGYIYDLVGCTGKRQSVGYQAFSKDASSQTDPVLFPVAEGYIRKNQELSAKDVALQEEVDSFYFCMGSISFSWCLVYSDNKTKFYTGLPTYLKSSFWLFGTQNVAAWWEEEKSISNGRMSICSDVTLVGSGGRECCRQIPHFHWYMLQSTWIKVTAQEKKVIF